MGNASPVSRLCLRGVIRWPICLAGIAPSQRGDETEYR